MKTYIIGDVHGMYDTLIALLSKIEANSRVIFVGDLIDRGAYSADVVKFVRDSGYECVLGNHEEAFIRFFNDYFSKMSFEKLKNKWSVWLYLNGGKESLQSYNIWDNNPSKEAIKRVKDDLEWMKALPIFIELNIKHKSNLPVVVSHSNISKVWHLKDKKDRFKDFKNTALRTRDLRYKKRSKIVSIFGHTPTKKIDKEPNIVNVDFGCYIDGYAKLVAYCIEDDKFIFQERL